MSFNDGWTVQPKTSIHAALEGAAYPGESVMLPHNARLALPRSGEHGDGAHNGFFPSAALEYSKSFEAPDAYRGRRVTLELQGSYAGNPVSATVAAGQGITA
jgi:hypothetical protein